MQKIEREWERCRNSSKGSGHKETSTYFFRAAELPIDPYWGALILAIYRLVLSFLALFFVKKLPRRLTYITCIGLASIATFMMGTFFFLQSQDDTTFFDNMYIKFMPVIALMVFYFCLSFALLNIPGSFEDIGVFLDPTSFISFQLFWWAKSYHSEPDHLAVA